MQIRTDAAQIAPSIVPGKYMVRTTSGHDYLVALADLATVLFREWRAPRFIFDRGMMGDQILRRV